MTEAKKGGAKSLGEKIVDGAKAAVNAVADAAGGLVGGDDAAASDERRENAEQFAERAEAQLDKASADDAASDYERAKLGLAENFNALPENAELQLRLSDGVTFIGGAIDVDREQLKPDYAGTTYASPIHFLPDAEPAKITEAWLIAANGDAVRCGIHAGLQIGGGLAAELPANSLIF